MACILCADGPHGVSCGDPSHPLSLVSEASEKMRRGYLPKVPLRGLRRSRNRSTVSTLFYPRLLFNTHAASLRSPAAGTQEPLTPLPLALTLRGSFTVLPSHPSHTSYSSLSHPTFLPPPSSSSLTSTHLRSSSKFSSSLPLGQTSITTLRYHPCRFTRRVLSLFLCLLLANPSTSSLPSSRHVSYRALHLKRPSQTQLQPSS
jgi:hypothetical protein